MPYIRLKVRSGGIYIKQKKDFHPIDLELTPHPEDDKQEVLCLIRDSSIKGLFSYLMGETKKLYYREGVGNTIEGSSSLEVQKLDNTLNKMVEASYYKKITEPYITTFFERRDIHREKSKFILNPKIPLYQHTFETADPTIKLLETPLKNICKNHNSLGEIHSIFKDCVIKPTQEEAYDNLKKKTDTVKSHSLNKIPESPLKKGIITALKRITNERPISSKVIELISKICSLCDVSNTFSECVKKSRYGKFSVFTNLSNTKQWVDKKYHSVVRGSPAYLACINFNIYLSESAFNENPISNCFNWEDGVSKIKNGPNIARWGEGGVVFIDYSGLDEMGCPCDVKEQAYVEISSLRRAGMKIRKYDWEETDNKVDK